MERLKYMANRSTAQIRMRMGRGMFLLVFFFAIGTLLSLLFIISLFAPAHAKQIQNNKQEKRRQRERGI